jgi:hypothetical protein
MEKIIPFRALALRELAEELEIAPARLSRLVSAGVVHPDGRSSQALLFLSETAKELSRRLDILEAVLL